MRAGVDQRRVLDQFPPLPLDGLQSQQGTAQSWCAAARYHVVAAQPLAGLAFDAVQQCIRRDRLVPDVARPQEANHALKERAIFQTPEHARQVHPLQVGLREERHHVVGGAILRDSLPRLGIHFSGHGDDRQHVARDLRRRDQHAVLGDMRREVRKLARRGEVEGVFDATRRIRVEDHRHALGDEAVLHRQRTARDLQEQLQLARRRGRIGQHDLAAVDNIGDELARHEAIEALAVLKPVAVIQTVVVLAEQHITLRRSRLRRQQFAPHEQDGRCGPQRPLQTIALQLGRVADKRQVDQGECEHHLGEAARARRKVWRAEGRPFGSSGEVRPERVDRDHRRTLFADAATPVVGLRVTTSRVNLSVELRHFHAASQVRLLVGLPAFTHVELIGAALGFLCVRQTSRILVLGEPFAGSSTLRGKRSRACRTTRAETAAGPRCARCGGPTWSTGRGASWLTSNESPATTAAAHRHEFVCGRPL